VDVYLMTASDVRGCGRQRGYTENYRGNEGFIRLLSKVKLEIAVNEEFVQPAVDAIMGAAHSGNIGDGKIFVLPLDECYRIRTRETGHAAIGP
jgi:nitrogen regulatory protein P-II 2